MNTEQERAAFEAACRKHAEVAGHDGHERLERDGDGYADPHTQAAWWGWREGRTAMQPQKAIAYMTRNEEGDPAMLFFDLAEARLYCNPNEEPEPLVLPGRAQ